VPRKSSKEEIEDYRRYVESILVAVTEEAETWAADGSRRVGERGFFPVPKGAIEL
jgi:histone H3/H4